MAKLVEMKPEHAVAYGDLCALLNKHADKVTALELLAIGANMLGKLLALQDQRTLTPAQGLQVVAENIECGNREMLQQLMASQGGA